MGRWSHTVDQNGAGNRFYVWTDAGDAYDHNVVWQNWDTLDSIIGGNSATWPPQRGASGGIYQEIANVSADLTPIGTVIQWWRPNSSVSLPSGWVPCDGRQVSDHSYGGTSPINVPDLRNRFVLGTSSPDGGNATVPGGAYSYPGDASAGVDSDALTSSPGIGGVGGSNAPNAHTHTLPHHYHIHHHIHELNDFTGDGTGVNSRLSVATGNAASTVFFSHYHGIDAMTEIPRQATTSIGNTTLYSHTSLPVWSSSGAAVNISNPDQPLGGQNIDPAINQATTLTGSQKIISDPASYDPRPHYYGLLYLVKVKRIATT